MKTMSFISTMNFCFNIPVVPSYFGSVYKHCVKLMYVCDRNKVLKNKLICADRKSVV